MKTKRLAWKPSFTAKLFQIKQGELGEIRVVSGYRQAEGIPDLDSVLEGRALTAFDGAANGAWDAWKVNIGSYSAVKVG